MFDQPIEVVVRENFGGYETNIYIVSNANGVTNIAQIKDGNIVWVKYKAAVENKPTFRLRRDIWNLLKDSMVKNHERDKHVVEAELGATKYHLEDMRKLVFEDHEKEIITTSAQIRRPLDQNLDH